jgi:hypothetical protein
MPKEPIKFETAFIVAKHKDLGYLLIKTLDNPIEVERKPDRLDIKGGLQDLLDAVVRNETIDAIMHKLDEKDKSSTEKASRSLRQALSDKGIL